jgi:hypothetical protein
MIRSVAEKLDAWMMARNLEARAEGVLQLRPCRIRILGQMALLEGGASLTLALTRDVDVYADWEHEVQSEFRRLLAREGLDLDPLGDEIWMPGETEYADLYRGRYATVQVADIDSVLLSKALKAPEKNRALLVEYLAGGPSERFLKMAEKYGLDLERFP